MNGFESSTYDNNKLAHMRKSQIMTFWTSYNLAIQGLLVLSVAFSLVHVYLILRERLSKRFRHHQRSQASVDICNISKKISPPKVDPSDSCAHYYKELFFKLQNLEEHREILPEAYELLISLLSESLDTVECRQGQGIFSIENFSEEQLLAFLHKTHHEVEDSYTQYLENLQAGGSRHVIASRQQATAILTQLAPVKLIDGAWLSHVHHVDTPFNLRHVTKGAWQILSEELGDGNLDMNHSHVYRELLQELGVELPQTHSLDFIHPKIGLKNASVFKSAWVFKSAVVQLLISLFPQHLLPEMLGYNLHFESLTLQTALLSKELKQLGLNPRYFLLHISIDNLHSGHAMMSAHMVTRYLTHVERSEGKNAAQTTWKRIQAGYALSCGSDDNPESPLSTVSILDPSPVALREVDRKMLAMLTSKAAVAQRLHLACPAKIGGIPLSSWLKSGRLESRQAESLQELAQSETWIVPGNASKSRLIREMRWGGKMFGAFTDREVALFTSWIDSLDLIPKTQEYYWQCTGRDHAMPVSLTPSTPIPANPLVRQGNTVELLRQDDEYAKQPLPSSLIGNWLRIIPLWFCQVCLLESYISIPSRAATPLGCAVLRVLRAQHGFETNDGGVSGIDEFNRVDAVDLIELGQEMLRQNKLHPLPESLSDVLAKFPCPFSNAMLVASKYPMANIEVLIGMSLGLVDMQRAVARSETLLSGKSRLVLNSIITKETAALKECEALLSVDVTQHKLFLQGYRMAKTEISSFE